MNWPVLTIRQLSPTHASVSAAGTVLGEWRDANTVEVPHAEYTTLYRQGRWDGRKKPGQNLTTNLHGQQLYCTRGLLLSRLTQSFTVPVLPDGLNPSELHKIRRIIKSVLGDRTFRDYQHAAVDAALISQWGRVALATNAGKGAVIALIAWILFNVRSYKTLILCDEKAVFDALVDEIKKWISIDVAQVRAGAKDPPDYPFVVAMVQTLGKRVKESDEWKQWLGSFQCVLCDEADKATADTWQMLLRNAVNSTWRIGFSGTFPNDPVGMLTMDETFGPELIRAKNIDMIAQGVSATPIVQLRGYDNTGHFVKRVVRKRDMCVPHGISIREWFKMDADERRRYVYDTAVINNMHRHAFVASLIKQGEPTVIVVTRIDHGEALHSFIPGSEFLSGEDTDTQRRKVLEEFKAGRINPLIVTKIFDRGTNHLGVTSALIFASGEGSVRQTLQRIGRGLRRARGKEFLYLIDIIDRGQEYLAYSAQRRIKLYHDEGFEVEIIP